MPKIEATSAYYETMRANPKARPPMTEGDPQPGRYRMRNGEDWQPVAIWREDGVLKVVRGGAGVELEKNHSWIWMACAKHPVSPEEYRALVDGTPAIRAIRDAMDAKEPEDMVAAAAALGALPLSDLTPEDAQDLADAANALKRIEKAASDCEELAVAPYRQAIADAKATWGEPQRVAAESRRPIMEALTDYLVRSNSPNGIKSRVGRAISLRTDKKLEITDYDACFAHFAATDPEQFRSAVEKAARAALTSGTPVPGARIIEVRRAQ